jgi:hypothetical protein
MSNYLTHAEAEFKAVGWTDENGVFKDEMQGAICKSVLDLLEVFAKEGHSGSSAPYAISIFSKLAKFEPIGPITGEDWEWEEASPGMFQNKRCSHVFKDPERFDGRPYDSNAVVFYDTTVDENGEEYKSYFTGKESSQPITFPYAPKTEYRPSAEEVKRMLNDGNKIS